jgi:hypothetical protein
VRANIAAAIAIPDAVELAIGKRGPHVWLIPPPADMDAREWVTPPSNPDAVLALRAGRIVQVAVARVDAVPGSRVAVTPATRFVLALLVAALFSAWPPPETEPARRFQLTGAVAGHELSGPRSSIAHDAVDGPDAGHEHAVRNPRRWASVREGDRIAATLVVTSSRSWLEERPSHRAGCGP